MTRAALGSILRVARRTIGRSRGRSFLVALLIALPVAAMVGAGTITRTVTPSAERIATGRMGAADLIAFPGSSEATIDRLRAALPPGSRIEPIHSEEGRLVLPGMTVSVSLRAADLEGLARGTLTLVDGRLPRSPGEVAISEPVARLAAAGLGGTVELEGLGDQRVVGIVEDGLNLRARVVLRDVSAAAAAASRAEASWLVGLPTHVDAGAMVLPPDFGATSRDRVLVEEGEASPTIILLGGLALVEAALVAAAAFAVGIRRRQRELGILAAAGAEPRHVAGTVIAEGGLLGGLAAIAGAVVGVLGALVSSPWLDSLTDRRNPPLIVDPMLLLAAAAIGLVAALIAALVPAWTAARLPVLVALSGRRPPTAPARRTLALGIVLIGAGILLTALGAALRLRDPDSSSILVLLAGAVVGTLGFGACSPWLIERLESPASRLPLASRIALRDTARARSRNGPIVTAVLASFAATVAVAAYTTSGDAAAAASWRPWLRPDQVYVQGPGFDRVGPEVARDRGAIAAGAIRGIGSDERSVWLSMDGSDDPATAHYNITVGDAELLRALGAEAATADLESGAVVLLVENPASIEQVTIHAVDADGAPVDSITLPARVIVTGIMPGDLPEAVVSTATAARLGVGAGANDRFIVRLDHPVTDADLARAAAIAAAYPDTRVDASTGPSRPGDGLRTAALIGSLLLALSITGVAVALGEAESRPEQRSLLAVGADPNLRRRIAAARAGVLALLAGALAVPAGLLPVWGLLASRQSTLVVPVPEVLASLAVLPLLAMVGTFLLSRPIPSWTAFRST